MFWVFQDIPSIAADAAKEHPGISYIVTAPLGLHELLVVSPHSSWSLLFKMFMFTFLKKRCLCYACVGVCVPLQVCSRVLECVCVCLSLSLHVFLCEFPYGCLSVHVWVCACVCLCMCFCVGVPVCAWVCVLVFLCAFVFEFVRVFFCMSAYFQALADVHVKPYTYVYVMSTRMWCKRGSTTACFKQAVMLQNVTSVLGPINAISVKRENASEKFRCKRYSLSSVLDQLFCKLQESWYIMEKAFYAFKFAHFYS